MDVFAQRFLCQAADDNNAFSAPFASPDPSISSGQVKVVELDAGQLGDPYARVQK